MSSSTVRLPLRYFSLALKSFSGANCRRTSLFASVKDRLEELCDPTKFIGRAPQQVDEFLDEHVEPALQERKELFDGLGEGEVRI